MTAPASPTPESDALLALIVQQYGDRLTPAMIEEVRQGVASLTHDALALRAVPLANSDEPGTIFVPYRQED